MPTFQRRILHVLDSLERGGIATWLMTVLRQLDPDRFRMDFLVHTDSVCAYDDEARSLGAGIINLSQHKNILSYVARFSEVLKGHGPYDVLHGHCHRFTGLNLLLASRAGVPTRIAHSHNDLRSEAIGWGPARRVYHGLMDRLIDRYATVGLAAGRMAAEDLFGENWRSDPRWRILFCGIDFTSFRTDPDRPALMAELGLANDSKVIVHVGRFTHQKNVPFILEVFAHAVRKEPRLRLVFIGDGELEESAKQRVLSQNLEKEVLFLGSRPDVPRLLLGVADLFIFPSLYEGLGLALVEAQAAGVPCLVSENIPEEADVAPALVMRLPLSLPADAWADEALQLLKRERPVSRQEALSMAEKSPFNAGRSTKQLEEVYSGSLCDTQ